MEQENILKLPPFKLQIWKLRSGKFKSKQKCKQTNLSFSYSVMCNITLNFPTLEFPCSNGRKARMPK